MNRSVERRECTVSGTTPGEILTGNFTDPARGQVHCPATPLVAASIRRAGGRVREVNRLRSPVAAGKDADGVLFTASYLDREKGPIGLAAAAHKTDVASVTAAREAVWAWSTIWRTRRFFFIDSEFSGLALRRAQNHARIPAAAAGSSPKQGEPSVFRTVLERAFGDADDCNAVVCNMEPIERAASACDRLFVLGEPSSALLRATSSTCFQLITDPHALLPSWLAGAECVGIVPAGRDGTRLLPDLVDVLSGLGPMSIW